MQFTILLEEPSNLLTFCYQSFIETLEAKLRYCHSVQKLSCYFAIYSIKQNGLYLGKLFQSLSS